MDRLHFLDAAFLYAETDNTPMHVAGLQHFEVPEGSRDGYFKSIKSYIAQRAHLIPFMMRRLKGTPLGLDHPIWVWETEFDINYHIQRHRLPPPGTHAQLEQAVAHLHEIAVDRARPLWRYWLIEGLESGHIAWYTKYHHTCMDGVSGQAIITTLFNESPEVKPVDELAEFG